MIDQASIWPQARLIHSNLLLHLQMAECWLLARCQKDLLYFGLHQHGTLADGGPIGGHITPAQHLVSVPCQPTVDDALGAPVFLWIHGQEQLQVPVNGIDGGFVVEGADWKGAPLV